MSRGGGAAARAGAALTVNFSSLRPSTFQALCTRTWESASARSGTSSARLPPLSLPPRTNWSRLVPPLVLSGHVSSLPSY